MAILALILALIQGIPIAPQAGGTVSGVLRNAEGKPAAHVRVSARTQQESLASVALASLAETDEDGRYVIENIPPGQYYIVAGSIDRPTYYPGTQDMTTARVVQITSGARLSGFDFAVSASSERRDSVMPLMYRSLSIAQTDLRVVAESGSRLPVSSSGGPVTLEFERVSDGMVVRALSTAPAANLDLLATGSTTDYRVRVVNLPEGFFVRRMTHGGTDVSSGILALPTQATLLGAPQNSAVPSVAFQTLVNQSLVTVVTGGVSATGTLTVTIAESPVSTSPARGVRIRGLNRVSDTHPVFLSGRPGAVFRDGTFEFRDVPPGRHVIASIDFPGRALGTTLIVGEQEIDNVTLDDIAALPTDIQSPVAPGPVGNAAPGTRIRPVVLRGVVLDRTTQQPPPSGQAYISGRRGPSYYFDADGKFEVDGLLPGTYTLEVQVAGYPLMTRELKVDVDDIQLTLELEK